MAERIMVASGKGGVGKSTVCLGLAAGLADLGKQVLLLEADTGFRGLDITLSLQEQALHDLSDLLEKRSTLDDTLLRHNRTGVELICAPNDPEYLPGEQAFADLLAKLDSQYDFILLDCGAGFGPMQGRVARNSTLALVVTLPNQVAVRSAARISYLLHKKGLARQRLIINRILPRLPQDSVIADLDDVIDLVGVQLIGAVPEGQLSQMPRRDDSLAAEALFRTAQRLAGQQPELAIYKP